MDELWEELELAKEEGFGVEDLIESEDFDRDRLYGYAKSELLKLEELITNSFYLGVILNK